MKKTFKKWEKSDLDLDDYLGEIPCEIDEELYNFIGECVAPQYLGGQNGLVQGGDAFDSEDTGEDFEEIFTYSTCRQIGEKFYYLGILPEFKQ